MVIAVVLDYLFIVQLFQADYYQADVFLYYALTFLTPVGVGLYLIESRRSKTKAYKKNHPMRQTDHNLNSLAPHIILA